MCYINNNGLLYCDFLLLTIEGEKGAFLMGLMLKDVSNFIHILSCH